MASLPELKLNAQTIGLAMGLIGLVTVGINSYNWLLSGRAENAPLVRQIVVDMSDTSTKQAIKDAEQDTRLDRTDRDRARNIEATQKLTEATQSLDKSITRLTTVMEQNGLFSKKAEWEMPAPISRPANYEVVR